MVIELGLKNVQSGYVVRVEESEPAAPFVALSSRAFAELADFVGLTRLLLAAGVSGFCNERAAPCRRNE